MPACSPCGRDTAWNAEICRNCGATPPHGGARASDALVKMLGTALAIFILGKFFGVW